MSDQLADAVISSSAGGVARAIGATSLLLAEIPRSLNPEAIWAPGFVLELEVVEAAVARELAGW